MVYRSLLRAVSLLVFTTLFGLASAWGDTSHTRIVRLSLVQGDVRFARDVRSQDPLADSSLTWESAPLNLPIRQGYVVATDNGRAEVEFENGAMAFLSEHTVLGFYDLSRQDGATTTRLILRQGSASFYVNPASGDYFSVTGGDFTVEATTRTEFRLDNFNDGSSVGVTKGRVTVARKSGDIALSKGQSLSIKAGDDSSLSIGHLAENDDFDRWVSGRVDSVSTATNAALQYSGGSAYTPGYADLMQYGSWYPAGPCGSAWRPYGYGLSWSPFDNGSWYFDPVFGWTFLGSQPWGWAPFHFGGWAFEPGLGWAWSSCGFGGLRWLPSTGVFVRRRPGLIGVVPIHPLDRRGRPPLNLVHGVFPVGGGVVGRKLVPAEGTDWTVVKKAPREMLTSNIVRTETPEHTVRSLASGPAMHPGAALSRESSIVYDAHEHKFVNAPSPPVTPGTELRSDGSAGSTSAGLATSGTVSSAVVTSGTAQGANGTATVLRTPAPPSGRVPGANVPPPPRTMTPPPAPHVSGGERSGAYSSPGAGSGRGSSGGGAGSVAHPSSSGGGGASHPSGGSSHPSGGGRPH